MPVPRLPSTCGTGGTCWRSTSAVLTSSWVSPGTQGCPGFNWVLWGAPLAWPVVLGQLEWPAKDAAAFKGCWYPKGMLLPPRCWYPTLSRWYP